MEKFRVTHASLIVDIRQFVIKRNKFYLISIYTTACTSD